MLFDKQTVGQNHAASNSAGVAPRGGPGEPRGGVSGRRQAVLRICLCDGICIYIYIYIERERERYTHTFIHMSSIVCVYIYIYTEREREMYRDN